MRILAKSKYEIIRIKILNYRGGTGLWPEWLKNKVRLRLVKTDLGKDLILLGFINKYFSMYNEYLFLITYRINNDSQSINYEGSFLQETNEATYEKALGFLDIPYSFAKNFINSIKKLIALIIVRNRWSFATGEYKGIA